MSALAMWGCATGAVVPLPRAEVAPAEAIRVALARQHTVESMRARFHTVVTIAASDRSAEGVLIVQRPDRFRLRLFSSFGLSFFDYLESAGRAWIAMPGQNNAAAPMFAPSGLGAVFLGRREIDPSRCEITTIARCADAAGAVEIDLEHAVLLRETRRTPDGDEIDISYFDQRPVEGTLLPYRIVIVYPAQHLTLRIEIDRYELNPPFGDELFTPPAGARPIALGAAR